MCAASWGFPSSHTPRAEAITFEATPVVHHSKFRRPMSAVGHARRTDTLRRSRHVRFTPENGHRKTWLVMSALCQNVWPGHAVQDGLPRSANVRAASMYQASEVEQFAPGHHGYPRASEAD